MKTHVKKDDQVVIISGGHKGKSGVILSVNPTKLQVIIKGVHMIKKHVKKTQSSEGGIIEREGPIHLSNVTPCRSSGEGKAQGRQGCKTCQGPRQKACQGSHRISP